MAGSAQRSAGIGTSAAVLLLVAAAPRPLPAISTLADAGSAVDPLAPVLALLTLLAWGLVGWLGLSIAATAGGHLPGQLGRVLAGLARRTAPVAVRRTVELTLGLTVVVGAATTPALADGPALPPPAAVPAGSATAPDLDWPATSAPACTPSPGSTASAPAIVVRPGDTLWDLAEADLRDRTGTAPSPARVAQAWPRWWAANRDAVGADPHLLHPGTRLSPPPHR